MFARGQGVDGRDKLRLYLWAQQKPGAVSRPGARREFQLRE
jgi:hypothetical protein